MQGARKCPGSGAAGRAVARRPRTIIGEGVYIHIFVFCPTDFF
jgi:hypothetical protein